MLKHRLGNSLFICQAESYRQTLKILNHDSTFDVIICDVNMPDLSAWRHLGHVTRAGAPAPVIACSAAHDSAAIASTRAMGASGFLSKCDSLENVVTALDAVLDGRSYFPEKAPAPPPSSRREPGPENLTPAELRVLSGLVQGLSNKEIARREGVSANAIKIHVKHIFAKLGVQNRTQAAMRAAQILETPNIPDETSSLNET